MPSVADGARASLRAYVMTLSVDQRIALGARLAESDLDIFCAAQGIARDEASRLLQRRRNLGRRPSCADEAGR